MLSWEQAYIKTKSEWVYNLPAPIFFTVRYGEGGHVREPCIFQTSCIGSCLLLRCSEDRGSMSLPAPVS